jgi:hypothetical protein
VSSDSYRRFGEAQYPPPNRDQLCVLWACEGRVEGMLAVQGGKGKVKCTLVQALTLCTDLPDLRGSRGIALLSLGHGTRR